MKRVYLSLLLLVTLALPSCTSVVGRRDESGGKLRVGIVFDIGGKDDKSFNAAAWEGVKRAKEELGIFLRDVEPGDPTSIEPSMRAFAERGYEATSVEEIAERAGITKPIVYEHFGGKEGLYAVVVDREVEHIVARIVEAISCRFAAVLRPFNRATSASAASRASPFTVTEVFLTRPSTLASASTWISFAFAGQ